MTRIMEFWSEPVLPDTDWEEICGEHWLLDPPVENLLDAGGLSPSGRKKAAKFLAADAKARKEARRPLHEEDDLFLTFAGLDGSLESVARFAKRYGRLGISKELPQAQLLGGGVWVNAGESLQAWQEAIRVMRVAIRFWRADAADADPSEKKEARAEIERLAGRKARPKGDLEDAESRRGESDEQDESPLFHSLCLHASKEGERATDEVSANQDGRTAGRVEFNLPISIALDHLTLRDGTSWFLHRGKGEIANRRARGVALEALTDQFAGHLIDLRLVSGDEYELAIRPRSLWGLLWAQLMTAVAGTDRYYRCVECRQVYRLEDKGRSTRIFCSNRCSQRDYRKRMYAAEKLWNEGFGPEEIAATLNRRSGREATSADQVRRWIARGFK